MFGLFLFLGIFVTLCLLVSESQNPSTSVQTTKTTGSNPNIKLRSNVVDSRSKKDKGAGYKGKKNITSLDTTWYKLVRTLTGAIPVMGFKPAGLLGQAKNEGVKPDDTDQIVGGAVVAGGAAAGAGFVAAVGNMGLVGAFGGVGIGMAPVAVAGGFLGAAGYGAVKAVIDKDIKALGAVAGGGLAGAGAAAIVGNMGLAVAGGAVAVGAAPVIAVGAFLGMGGYGLWRLFGGK